MCVYVEMLTSSSINPSVMVLGVAFVNSQTLHNRKRKIPHCISSLTPERMIGRNGRGEDTKVVAERRHLRSSMNEDEAPFPELRAESHAHYHDHR